MSDTQQLPLFATLEETRLSRQTALLHAVEPFQQHLRKDGKTQNTIKGFSMGRHHIIYYFSESNF